MAATKTPVKRKTSEPSVEARTKIDPKQIKKDHIVAVLNYTKVLNVDSSRQLVVVKDLENGNKFQIQGDTVLANCLSADQYNNTKEVTKTEAAEILVSAHNTPIVCEFVKSDGTNRLIRCKFLKAEVLLGRSYVQDLDIPTGEHNVRQIDHREILWLVVNGTKYVVK